MKKSTFITMLLGTLGGLLFALGMCMTLIKEWNTFAPGLVFGILGIIILVITLFVWRKMEGKPKMAVDQRTMGAILIGVIGAMLLGLGMSLVMVWGHFIIGIVLGIIGILILMCMLPVLKGFK
ncbi:hypothetical protein DW996_08890 [Roseburia sp. AM51-8]|uniref:hypothetical protein n=1 Tax=Roseburia sp. AM51-8 TaxID=2292366 RepID=UPI000E540599|nr:hypothetical protein [Roseburia sp. AM51-8]RHQ00459.1 hypothetical protein DW996_08890 [Roseburia sp. AM51-8]